MVGREEGSSYTAVHPEVRTFHHRGLYLQVSDVAYLAVPDTVFYISPCIVTFSGILAVLVCSDTQFPDVKRQRSEGMTSCLKTGRSPIGYLWSGFPLCMTASWA